MKCKNCDKEFIQERSSAKFCSTVCRVDASRKKVGGGTEKKVVVDDVSSPWCTDCVESDEHNEKCLACWREQKNGKKDCGQKYYQCMKHGFHIQSYCDGFCVKSR